MRERGLKRDVVVFFPRVLELFAAQHHEGAAEAAAGRPRLDDVVDKAAAGRNERVGKFLAVLLGARLDGGGIAEIAAEDDLDRPFWPHYRDLGRWPGEIDVAAQVLRAHHVV